ncbi:hypothetical protein S2L_33 [Cyanophage S-2L]|nr:hypothetical protein S2L_33 [Cyanophage S-2L]
MLFSDMPEWEGETPPDLSDVAFMLLETLRSLELRFFSDRLPGTTQHDRMLATEYVNLCRHGWTISKSDLADAMVWAEETRAWELRLKG